MIQNLKNGSLDVIVALTEGIVADIARGSDLRILGTYVESPLCWAVSAGAQSDIRSIEDLRGQTIGISRLQSGSHLMSFVLAHQRQWDTSGLKFEVKGNFDNLCKSVNDGSTQAFLWESFMTKPWHDRYVAGSGGWAEMAVRGGGEGCFLDFLMPW
jgi:sulfonate transport system substrate-binding protein